MHIHAQSQVELNRKVVGVLQSPWRNTRAEDEEDAYTHNLVEAPYGGSVHHPRHWTGAERETRSRPLLAVAAFNDRGHGNEHGQMDVRRALRAQCEAAGTPRCKMIDLRGFYVLHGGASRYHMMRETLTAYRQASFALQPAGDDPARKGIIDSLTSGCVPVLFHPDQSALWPEHWGTWVNESR